MRRFITIVEFRRSRYRWTPYLSLSFFSFSFYNVLLFFSSSSSSSFYSWLSLWQRHERSQKTTISGDTLCQTTVRIWKIAYIKDVECHRCSFIICLGIFVIFFASVPFEWTGFIVEFLRFIEESIEWVSGCRDVRDTFVVLRISLLKDTAATKNNYGGYYW